MFRAKTFKRVANIDAIPLTNETKVGDTFFLDNGELYFVYSKEAGGDLNIGAIPVSGVTLLGLDSFNTEVQNAIFNVAVGSFYLIDSEGFNLIVYHHGSASRNAADSSWKYKQNND